MFLQSEKDIDQQKGQNQVNIALRCFKPKLISSLNYEQQYLIRRKQKRNNRGRDDRNKPQSESTSANYEITYGPSEDERQQSEIENNFYKEVYDGNDKICGYWVNGLLEGQAQIQYQNGDFFKGKFEKGYKVEGLMVFKDQGSYQGRFYNQQFHGKGVLRLKEKTISALWANGMVEGNCVVEYKNRNVYYGPLKQFNKHGYGYLYFPNDTKFFGQFVDGMVKGYGEFHEKGKLKCKGLWKNGKLVQEKKQEDWSYNFDEENIDWGLIEELFEKKATGIASCFEMITNQQTKVEDDQEQFREMLETIKRTNRSSQKSPASIESYTQAESCEQSQVQKVDTTNTKPNIFSLFGNGIFKNLQKK